MLAASHPGDAQLPPGERLHQPGEILPPRPGAGEVTGFTPPGLILPPEAERDDNDMIMCGGGPGISTSPRALGPMGMHLNECHEQASNKGSNLATGTWLPVHVQFTRFDATLAGRARQLRPIMATPERSLNMP